MTVTGQRIFVSSDSFHALLPGEGGFDSRDIFVNAALFAGAAHIAGFIPFFIYGCG